MISVLPSYQGRGIGKTLLCYIAERLEEDNLHSLWLEVLAVNPNRDFYEHLDAKYVTEHPYDWVGVALTACVYGWLDTQRLLSHCKS